MKSFEGEKLMGMKTVFWDKHKELGARMVEFGGWEMPVQYTGIIEEHKAVRNSCGLFDVSHMGQVFVRGKDSLNYLQKIVPQDISKLVQSKAVYCQLPYENGGLVDDLIIYHLNEDEYLIIVNAANIQKDFDWFLKNKEGFDVLIENRSDEYSMLALQGPYAYKIVEKLGIFQNEQSTFFSIKNVLICDSSVMLARTGYTGEDGFEIIMKNSDAVKLWDCIFEAGKEYHLKPIGLGARDTLRLEAALMLYGNDLNSETTPVEAGLKWSIPKDKTVDYNGKSVIMSQIQNGTAKNLIGFEMTDRAIPRHEYDIWYNGHKAGFVSSGGYSPTLDKNIGMGYVDTNDGITLDSTIQIMVRNKLYNAKVVKRPFIQKKYKIS